MKRRQNDNGFGSLLKDFIVLLLCIYVFYLVATDKIILIILVLVLIFGSSSLSKK